MEWWQEQWRQTLNLRYGTSHTGYKTPAYAWKPGGKSKIFGKELTGTLKDEKYNIWNGSLVGKFNRLDT